MKNKLNRFINSVYSTHLMVALIFVSLFILSLFFIWTHDDYTTVGTYSFMEAFKGSVYFGNGRFLGNFLVDFIMPYKIIDRAVRTLFIGIIVVTSALIVDGYRKRSLLLSSLLYVGLGTEIFKQVFVWGHGFYNYVPPVSLMLLSIYLLKSYYSKEEKAYLYYAPLAILGASQQLFAENTTTISCLIALIILAYVIYNKSNNKIPAIIHFSASLLGAGIMFLAPKLLKVADKMDDYRKINGLSEYISNAVNNTYDLLCILSTQTILFAVISAFLLIMIIKKEAYKNKIKPVLIGGYLLLYPLISIIGYKNQLTKLCVAVAFVLYLILITVLVIKLKLFKSDKCSILLIALAIISVLQLLVVKPVAGRCLFVTYSLIVLFTLIFYKKVFDTISKKTIHIIYCSAIAGLILIYSVMLYNFINISQLNDIRINYINEQIAEGKRTVNVINLPYEYWLHAPNESYAYGHSFNQGDKDQMYFKYIDYTDYLELKTK